MNNKEYRRFQRRMRASTFSQYLKTQCDLGIYGYFIGPIPAPMIKEARQKILKLLK